MFKIIESPVQKTNITSPFNDSQSNRLTYQRYSSVDDSISRPQSSLNSSRLADTRQDKRYQTGEKTQRGEKQRTHSQKKLTLTSANLPNGSFNHTTNNGQNLSLLNARQAYEGFKKNLQLKSNNLGKSTPLEKKGKFTTMKTNPMAKFPTSILNIKLDNTQSIKQKQNDYEGQNSYVSLHNEKNRGLIQANSNNHYASNPQNFYKPEYVQTAPNSPVYSTSVRNINIDTQFSQISANQPINYNNQSIMQFCQQKIAYLKDQTNRILMDNSKKIKQLEQLLLENKQKLEDKDKIIRQLELNSLLKQTEKPQTCLQSLASSGHFRMASEYSTPVIRNNTNLNNDFLASKVNDLQKKIQILSKWSAQSQKNIDQKIDNMNCFMQNFITVKFHNLKFTLKTFMTKTEQKVNILFDSTMRIQQIAQINAVQSFEELLNKTKTVVEGIEKISALKSQSVQKYHFEDMKTTMNTAVDSMKNKTTQESFHNMYDSREVNESFWRNLEDFSGPQVKIQQPSFTDDSFSYAPGSMQFTPTSNQSENQFSLGTYPSFSKFSAELNICKESLQSMNSSIVEVESNFTKTIEDISKCRQGPILVFIDQTGSIRYKGSQSFIFDRKGNILKPTKAQINWCVSNKWISLV